MAVAVEFDPEDELGLIEDLLTQIYEDYSPKDPMPPGVGVESPWEQLKITASELGERAIKAYFDDDCELKAVDTSPLIDPVGLLVAIRECQQEAQRHLSALD